jgi:hypothetical protein
MQTTRRGPRLSTWMPKRARRSTSKGPNSKKQPPAADQIVSSLSREAFLRRSASAGIMLLVLQLRWNNSAAIRYPRSVSARQSYWQHHLIQEVLRHRANPQAISAFLK